MKKIAKLNYFSTGEYCLWGISVLFIILFFAVFDRNNYMTLIASLIGVTSLIFNAKGNPFGQVLMLVFSLLYTVISYSFAYYGEMITYMGMTAPMALFSLISWIRNPYRENGSEVAVNSVGRTETLFMLTLSVIVTVMFYFVLNAFNTENIFLSTVSVTTSFLAAYLTFRRSPLFALGYAANDVVLIILWIMAAIEDITYLSVVVCFTAFLVNDIYGYISWMKMQKRQSEDKKAYNIRSSKQKDQQPFSCR